MNTTENTPKRTAQQVIDTLCVPIGQRASAWVSCEHDDRIVHAGFASFPISQDGYEFAEWLGADLFRTGDASQATHIICLHQVGTWPYHMHFEVPSEHALIEYCEGDVSVTVYKTPEAFAAARLRL